ncbi:Hypothetical predicted protein [Cloeon dipterum]|uniref:Uncharacterized protein n=1 Tax=Cloeon dipterum TaxID=197152 RepID=A0A8S1CUX4_9INSE|nr:Hypothetical predicted protein [Cloeon dipterum]
MNVIWKGEEQHFLISLALLSSLSSLSSLQLKERGDLHCAEAESRERKRMKKESQSLNASQLLVSPIPAHFLIKIRFPLVSSFELTGRLIARTNYSSNYTVLSGPPAIRISLAEKFILGGIMCSSLFVVPAWVLVNIKKWNGSAKE